MLTAAGCSSRRDRLWAALPAPCDALIVGDPSHLTYFAGYSPSPFVFRTVESAAILLLQPGSSTLVADDMLGPFLEKSFVDERVAPVWYDGKHSAPIAADNWSNRLSPAWRTSPGTAWASSWREFPRDSLRGCGRRGRISKSSILDPSCVRCGGKRTPTRSRSCGGRCRPAKRAWPLPMSEFGRE